MSPTGQNVIVITLLVINAIVVAVYFILNWIIRGRKEPSLFIRALVMFLCPVVGVIFVGLSYLIFRIFFSEEVDLVDVIFSKEKAKFEIKAEEEKERNIIPLEEAIAITGKQDLRRLMMNVVSSDISSSLASITLALDSEDSETAHYAASVLQDTLNDFRAVVESNYRKILDDVPDKGMIGDYLCDYMEGVLKQKVFIDMEQRYFVDILDKAAEVCYTENKERMTDARIEMIAMRLLEIKSYERCEIWCDRSMEMFPASLSSYTNRIKLYFNSGRKEDFFAVVEELKSSAIVIDKDTLELMRVFR